MKCSSMKTIKVAFRRPHPVGNFHDLLLHERTPSLGGKSLKYQARLTIITRSNYTYHFLLPFKLRH